MCAEWSNDIENSFTIWGIEAEVWRYNKRREIEGDGSRNSDGLLADMRQSSW